MRFDTPVLFQRITEGAYNAENGDYSDDSVESVKVYADVTDAGVETLNLVYGELRQGAKVVRLLHHYEEPFDLIQIGRKRYRVDMERRQRTKHVFVVSEVQ